MGQQFACLVIAEGKVTASFKKLDPSGDRTLISVTALSAVYTNLLAGDVTAPYGSRTHLQQQQYRLQPRDRADLHTDSSMPVGSHVQMAEIMDNVAVRFASHTSTVWQSSGAAPSYECGRMMQVFHRPTSSPYNPSRASPDVGIQGMSQIVTSIRQYGAQQPKCRKHSQIPVSHILINNRHKDTSLDRATLIVGAREYHHGRSSAAADTQASWTAAGWLAEIVAGTLMIKYAVTRGAHASASNRRSCFLHASHASRATRVVIKGSNVAQASACHKSSTQGGGFMPFWLFPLHIYTMQVSGSHLNSRRQMLMCWQHSKDSSSARSSAERHVALQKSEEANCNLALSAARDARPPMKFYMGGRNRRICH